MSNEKVVSIRSGRTTEAAPENDRFSAIVTSIRSHSIIAFTSEEIREEIEAVFGGRLDICASGEVYVADFGGGENTDIGRIFNTMYAGRKFSRIEDVLAIALDMALEEIMVLRDARNLDRP